MKQSGLARICTILIIAACMCLSFFGTLLVMNHYVFADFRFYPKNTELLDLREDNVKAKTVAVLHRRLPDTRILWSVRTTDGIFPHDSTELRIEHLDEDDIFAISQMTELQTVHAENCRDYPQLVALQKKLPNAQVLYFVPVGGSVYDQDTEKVEISDLNDEQVALLECLPRLRSVDATGCTDFEYIFRLREERPQWHVTYGVQMGDDVLSSEASMGRANGAGYQEVAAGIPGLPNLQSLTLENPKATVDEMLQLRKDFPDVKIHWQMTVFDQIVTDDTEELDLSGIPMTDVAEAEAAADLCPNLKKLIMSDCGIDNETMAAFRERKRNDYKVVWTVHFSKKCQLRTDDIAFMPYKQGEYYFKESMVHDLMYCEDLETIDLGHHKIRTIEFVRYMPHLKFLILAHTEVQYIDPISACKELIYLELDFSVVRDLSPLVGCTALQDLNIGNTPNTPSIEPILTMTWLKNFWCQGRSGLNLAAMQEKLPNTNICLSSRDSNGKGWRNLPNYYQQRDNLGMYYMR